MNADLKYAFRGLRRNPGFAGTAIFAMVALTLATVGLYAVTAYSVAQRTREIGLRIALGAGAGHVWSLVASRASSQLLIGLTIGRLAGALAATSACVVPARRALSVDPSQTLREG